MNSTSELMRLLVSDDPKQASQQLQNIQTRTLASNFVIKLDPITELVLCLAESGDDFRGLFDLSFVNMSPVLESLTFVHHHLVRPVVQIALRLLLGTSENSPFHRPLDSYSDWFRLIRSSSQPRSAETLFESLTRCHKFLTQSTSFLSRFLHQHACAHRWQLLRSYTASSLFEHQSQMLRIVTLCRKESHRFDLRSLSERQLDVEKILNDTFPLLAPSEGSRARYFRLHRHLTNELSWCRAYLQQLFVDHAADDLITSASNAIVSFWLEQPDDLDRFIGRLMSQGLFFPPKQIFR